ncbi:D-tyrosyl-tRNA(Tyr) deacylase, variant [Verruconis gallopava]|uniref:D-aminoacyl-tRNA deacylase n=1 Tax=Verruconis gallopava TaxID=253628 RepID=A0A0D2AQL9_9PEZI|nr:D-tyrosyl-tRNA(Tyr) deacylase, variant [Verruconis gallopava]KIW08958.1 D-tyrosyl-tRNA(Tyr) deacylase, variant [Verruconis gallopava]
MKVVLQRVKSASVSVDGKLIASIGKGVLALAAVGKDDTIQDSERAAGKLLNMKLWDDESGGRWKKSVKDVGGEVLCISQFTLFASTNKGNKPSFHKSADAEKGRELYTAFFTEVQKQYDQDKVKDGVFQAMMDVALVNDGPVSENSASPLDEETPLCASGELRDRGDASDADQNLRTEDIPVTNENPPPENGQPRSQSDADNMADRLTKLPPLGIKYICEHEAVSPPSV